MQAQAGFQKGWGLDSPVSETPGRHHHRPGGPHKQDEPGPCHCGYGAFVSWTVGGPATCLQAPASRAAPGPSPSCLGPSTRVSRALQASASLPGFYLQHLQPPKGPEGPFFDAADLVLVQLPVKQRKGAERRHAAESRNVQTF